LGNAGSVAQTLQGQDGKGNGQGDHESAQGARLLGSSHERIMSEPHSGRETDPAGKYEGSLLSTTCTCRRTETLKLTRQSDRTWFTARVTVVSRFRRCLEQENRRSASRYTQRQRDLDQMPLFDWSVVRLHVRQAGSRASNWALIGQRVAVDYGGGWRESEPWGVQPGVLNRDRERQNRGRFCSRKGVDWYDPLRGMR
jgi:hypothetical protein